ncbi:MAG: hypothetical protein RBJ76_16785 [Stenomitos frigidus ULC029]
MNCNRFSTVMLLTIATLMTPLAAIAALPYHPPRTIAQTSGDQAQAEPTARQVLEACVQNRAETLPNPFVDVPTNHWAFKAVLTMHYCGAYRQATPPSLIERLTNQQPASVDQ